MGSLSYNEPPRAEEWVLSLRLGRSMFSIICFFSDGAWLWYVTLPKPHQVFLQLKFALGCIYMYITAASPNKRSLGATNGLALTLVSIGRLVAPAMANSLLAFSIQYHILWGYAAYIVLIFLTIGGIGLALQLPRTLNSMVARAP